MQFSPERAAIRFGTGLSPLVPAPRSPDEMMAELRGPDHAARVTPIAGTRQARPSEAEIRAAAQAFRDARGTAREETARATQRALRVQIAEARNDAIAASLARAAWSSDGLRERLTAFWADHFATKVGRQGRQHLRIPFIETAIRPHVSGRFADMLKAVTTHPEMIRYLDQDRSMGPTSPVGKRRGRGLNENLAREVMELHTLGAGGPFDQPDVTELAKLLTGMTVRSADGALLFRPDWSEPGPETVLDQTYGVEGLSQIGDIFDVLEDLAIHPATARNIAAKLATHFVSDRPDPALIDAMSAAFEASGGDLSVVTEAMIRHPAAWGSPEKVRRPWDFIGASLRALAVPEAVLRQLTERDMRHFFHRPMAIMGQAYGHPVGPDGWPEAEAEWVTPQGMAGRITWAMQVPGRLLEQLPDPRDFVHHALGATPPDEVAFAAKAAERTADGIGVVLSSAAFQRR